jgi:hypothetical protein
MNSKTIPQLTRTKEMDRVGFELTTSALEVYLIAEPSRENCSNPIPSNFLEDQ